MANQNNIIVGRAQLSVDGVNVGFTQGGVFFRKSNDFLDIETDQLAGVARKEITMQRAFVNTVLAEATLKNLRIAMAEPASQQFSGSALTLGQSAPTVTEHTLVVTGKASGAGKGADSRTWAFTRCVSAEEVEHVIGARDAAGLIPITFEVLKDVGTGNFATISDA